MEWNYNPLQEAKSRQELVDIGASILKLAGALGTIGRIKVAQVDLGAAPGGTEGVDPAEVAKGRVAPPTPQGPGTVEGPARKVLTEQFKNMYTQLRAVKPVMDSAKQALQQFQQHKQQYVQMRNALVRGWRQTMQTLDQVAGSSDIAPNLQQMAKAIKAKMMGFDLERQDPMVLAQWFADMNRRLNPAMKTKQPDVDFANETGAQHSSQPRSLVDNVLGPNQGNATMTPGGGASPAPAAAAMPQRATASSAGKFTKIAGTDSQWAWSLS